MLEAPILLVEDNDDHAELTTRAFKKAHVVNQIVRVQDGEEALDWLLVRGQHAGRTPADLPALILLDLNLPGLSGLEVLRAIRGEPGIKHVPVVILTSSDEESDRLAAYQGWANSYVRKPVDYEQLVSASREIGSYWLLLNRPAPLSRP